MNIIGVALLILSSVGQGRQVASLDVGPGTQIAPPQPSLLGSGGIRGNVLGHPKPPTEILMVIQHLKFDEMRSSLSYALKIENATDHELIIPVSQDGRTAVTKCQGLKIDAIGISYSSMNSGSTLIGGSLTDLASFYGCGSLTGSVLALKPGDWIMVNGTKRLSQQNKDVQVAAVILSREIETFHMENGLLRLDTTNVESQISEHHLD